MCLCVCGGFVFVCVCVRGFVYMSMCVFVCVCLYVCVVLCVKRKWDDSCERAEAPQSTVASSPLVLILRSAHLDAYGAQGHFS